MTTREKTIIVPINFGAVSDIIDATETSLGTATIYTPENSVGSPINITSAVLFLSAQDISTATGATLGETRAAVQLSGGTKTTWTETDDLTDSDENWGGLIGPIDFTSIIDSEYGTGTSKSIEVWAYFDVTTGTGVNVRGVYAWLEITYEYDDTATTHIKTICLPLSEKSGALSTTANTTFVTIPQLTSSGLLPEASVVIRHIWAVIHGNVCANAGTTDTFLTWGFDGSGGGGALPTRENAFASDTHNYYLIDLSGLSTTASHTLDLWSDLATKWHGLICDVYISYEYVPGSSSSVLNYIEVPCEFESPIPGTSSSLNARWLREILIPEPATITMKYAAVELCWVTGASSTAQIKVGSQASYTSYAYVASVVAGYFALQHRFDSGGGAGSGLTLARGFNDITIDLYRSAGSMYNVSGKVKILYESGISSDGVGAHSHIVRKLAREINFATTSDLNNLSSSFPIQESNYWLVAAGLVLYYFIQSAAAALMVQGRYGATEGPGSGWKELYNDPQVADNELSFGVWYVRARDSFKRHPLDPDTSRLDIETSRDYRVTSNTAFRFGIMWQVCYHSITFDVTGTISGSGGGTVNAYLVRDSNKEVISTGSRSGNGSITITWYDDTEDVFVVYYEDSTHTGCSQKDTAT